jgi:flagellar basal-body rod modification protein FlgD
MAAIASALPHHVAAAATTPGTSGTSNSNGTNSSSSSSSVGSLAASDSLANEQTFLQLLVAQLKNQDPSNPMDGTQFVTQLAEFSQLEQQLAMRQDLDKIAGSIGSSSVDPNTSNGNTNGTTGTDATDATNKYATQPVQS